MQPTILLLGANGLLGRAFGSEFTRRGIVAVSLPRSECDVTNRTQVADSFARHKPSVVINCTAYTKVDLAEKEIDRAFAVNADGVQNLAQSCAANSARLIHFSTDFVFNGKASDPYQPAGLTDALGVYGESKLRGETLLQQVNPPGWLIVRTSWLFGTTGPCFPQTILNHAKRGQPLNIVDDQVGSPTYAPDLAAAILDLIDKPVSGVHHVTNSGHCSWFEFARAIVAEFGISADIRPITTAQFLDMRPQQAKRPAYSVMVDDQVRRVLCRPMRSWQEALTDYRAALIKQ